MNKETYKFLRDEFSQVFLNIEDPRLADDVNNAIKELLPVPGPETGLVPCGCGGKAEIAGSSGDADYYSIICVECNIDTDSYEKKEDAKAAWNRAMGYKEDA